MPKQHIPLPGGNWEWETSWQVYGRDDIKQMNPNEGNDTETGELDHDNTYDKDGWQYAPEFGARFSGSAKLTDFVRRRKWVRTCAKTE